MGIVSLTPWQLLVWIVGLTILIVPIIAVGINAVIIGWYAAKEKYILRLTNTGIKLAGVFAESLVKELDRGGGKEE